MPLRRHLSLERLWTAAHEVPGREKGSAGFPASAAALLIAYAISSLWGRTALIRPSSSARSAPKGSASNSSSEAPGTAEPLRRSLGNEAEVDERNLEARFERGVDEIAMKAERRPNTDRQTVNRRDQPLFELGDFANKPPCRKFARLVQRDREKILCRFRL